MKGKNCLHGIACDLLIAISMNYVTRLCRKQIRMTVENKGVIIAGFYPFDARSGASPLTLGRALDIIEIGK